MYAHYLPYFTTEYSLGVTQSSPHAVVFFFLFKLLPFESNHTPL